jgi:uncharacterized protein
LDWEEEMHYLLFYELAPDYLERRAALRDEHLALAWQVYERGELLLGGALADPLDGAILLFQGQSPAVAEQFATADPYVRHGLVTAGAFERGPRSSARPPPLRYGHPSRSGADT